MADEGDGENDGQPGESPAMAGAETGAGRRLERRGPPEAASGTAEDSEPLDTGDDLEENTSPHAPLAEIRHMRDAFREDPGSGPVEDPAPEQNVFPTIGHDPFRSSGSQPPRGIGLDADADAEELTEEYTPSPLTPRPGSGRELEETEVTSPSLVAARSGLLPIPDDDDPRPSSDPPADDTGTGPLAVSLFVVMMLAAVAVLARRLPAWLVDAPPRRGVVVDRPSAAPSGALAVDGAARLRPAPSSGIPARAPDGSLARPGVAALEPDAPGAVLARLEPGLPAEASAAADALGAHARAYREQRRPEVALLLLRRAVELEPRHLDTHLQLAQLLLQQGAAEEAWRWARRATELAPRDAGAHVVLGDALAALGRADQAEQQWREARSLDPGSRPAAARSGSGP